MEPIDYFILAHQETKKKNYVEKGSDINLCLDGINLFLMAEQILLDIIFEYSNPKVATRTILWRYLASIPSTAYMALNCAVQGQIRISYSILRILIEEATSIRYYALDYQRALNVFNTLSKSGIPSEPKFNTKLRETEIKQGHSLQKLYTVLSSSASHANALEMPLPVDELKGRKYVRVAEPVYNEESFDFIMETMLRLLSISIFHFKEVYSELQTNKVFMNKLTLHIEKVDKRLEHIFRYGSNKEK